MGAQRPYPPGLPNLKHAVPIVSEDPGGSFWCLCWNAHNTLYTSGSAHPIQFTNGTIDVTPATRQINEETLRGVRAVAPRLFARYGLDSSTLMLMTTEALTELRNKQGQPDYVELEFITLIRRFFPTEQWLPAYSDACGDGVFTDSVKTK